MYTSSSSYPWYNTQSPLAISIPAGVVDEHTPEELKTFEYRYAVFQGGVFNRWEQPSDGPQDDDVAMSDDVIDQPDESLEVPYHRLPLRLLSNRETYVVNDVLGVTTGPSDVDHLRVPSQTQTQSAASLHSRDNSGFFSSQSLVSSGSATNTPQLSRTAKNKKVGFAPVPPPYHQKPTMNKQAVHLNSTDGLVVVSAFLPVHLHRSETGEWSADWDYEMLLSMQTHLRVTRVGVVKWRGWHGNIGPDGSPEAGVPKSERAAVEACLLPFNCVPVWIEPKLFGEM
jgi:trehalose 6-phosphate synthase/phosphatase